MSGLGKTGPGGVVVGALQGVFANERIYVPDMFQAPEGTWPITAEAILGSDSYSLTSQVREFADSAEQGIGFSLNVPLGVTTMQLRLPGRAGDSPAGASAVVMRLYARVGAGAWSGAAALGIINLPNDLPQSISLAILLSALSLSPGDAAQFLLTRNPASGSDTLVGRWFLFELGVNFA